MDKAYGKPQDGEAAQNVSVERLCQEEASQGSAAENASARVDLKAVIQFVPSSAPRLSLSCFKLLSFWQPRN